MCFLLYVREGCSCRWWWGMHSIGVNRGRSGKRIHAWLLFYYRCGYNHWSRSVFQEDHLQPLLLWEQEMALALVYFRGTNTIYCSVSIIIVVKTSKILACAILSSTYSTCCWSYYGNRWWILNHACSMGTVSPWHCTLNLGLCWYIFWVFLITSCVAFLSKLVDIRI